MQEFSRKLTLSQGSTLHRDTTLGPNDPVPQGTLTSMGSTAMTSTLGSSSEFETGDSYTYTYGDSTMSTGEKRVRIQTAVGLSYLE